MAEPRIDVDGLPFGVSGPYDTVVGVDEATGAARRFPMPQPGTPRSYATRASLPAASGFADGYTVWVNNDPTPANNGTWAVLGGAWVQSADRVTGLEGQTANYRAAGDPISGGDEDYALRIESDNGRAAVGVRDDGTVEAAAIEVEELIAAGSAFARESGSAFSIEDENGDAALVVQRDGTVLANLNSGPNTSRAGGRLTHEVVYIHNAGQSLANGGSDPAPITTVQSDDTVTLDSFHDPLKVVPAVVGAGAVGSGEPPMLGAAEMIKQLLRDENGIDWPESNYQLLVVNQGSNGARLDEIQKGGSRQVYNYHMACLNFTAAEYASRVGQFHKTVGFGATFFTQGESDQNLTPESTYTDRLIQYANDLDADGRAATGQTNRVPLICYQTHCHENVDGPKIGLALLEAHRRSPLIHMATPIYFMDFWDAGLHLDAESSKWLGAYYGLVYKRVVIDGLPWEPLRPIQHAVLGNTVTLFFTKGGLTFDTAGAVPAQPNYGFTARNSSGGAVSITSVEIVGSDRVRVTLASAPGPGWKIQYGNNECVGRPNYTEPAGNLRDRSGDALIYRNQNKPMHNWCVVFNYEL